MRPLLLVALVGLAWPAEAARGAPRTRTPPRPAAPPRAAPPKVDPGSSPGTPATRRSTRVAPVAPVDPQRPQVVSATSRRAFLNRGTKDGLAVGDVVALRRGQASAGECRVELASEHHASCLGTGLQAGDVFAPPEAPLEPPLAPRLPEDAPGAAAHAKLDRLDQPLKPFRSLEGWGTSRVLEATVEHRQWSGGLAGSILQERVDAVATGIAIGAGFRFNARVGAILWPSNGDALQAALGQAWSVRVRELSVTQREPDRSWTLSAGRLAPWHLPGVAIMDGVQAGWRSGRTFELGAYGGWQPTSASVGLDPTRWAAGAYYAASSSREDATWLRTVRHEARVGLATDLTGARFLDAQGQVGAVLVEGLEATTDVRVTAGQDGPRLAAWRLDVLARPSENVRILGGYRTFGPSPVMTDLGVVTAGTLRHGDVLGEWDATRSLRVGVDAGLAEDTAQALTRGWVGPTVALPRLFGDAGGVSVGYREELGWSAGRSAWGQLQARPGARFTIVTRLAWAFDAWGHGFDDVALFGSGEVRVLDWLALRASGQVRAGVDGVSSADAVLPVPVGYTASVALVARR